MHPEDRLDSLLTTRLRGARHLTPNPDDELAGALSAADRLASLRHAHPSAAFAETLEARLLAHAASLPSQQAAEPASSASPARATPAPQRSTHHGPRLMWQAIAAAVALVIIGGGTLTAAASARPGNPLYGLHQLEQHVQVALTSTAAGRARLHLAYANDALRNLDTAAANHADDTVYQQTLDTLRAEDAAAARELAAVPAGADRDALSTQLQQLHAREQHDLHSALPLISWSSRVATTTALGALGETVPVITSATAERLSVGGQHAWRVTITGSGFDAGCVVYLRGVPEGTILSVSATQVVVEVPPAAISAGASSIGVQNPDGTAASYNHATPPAGGTGVTGNATATSKDDQHGTTGGADHSGGDNRDSGHGNGNTGTPTPSATGNPHH